jgi:ABC-2 type transport system permease protein
MRFVLASARKDLRRLAREPVTLLVWLGVPVFGGVLLMAIFGGKPAVPHGLLLVADEDCSLISRFVSGAFSQGEFGRLFLVEQVEQAAGHKRMAAGGASALLVIPQGFGAAVLRNQPTRVTVVTNPSQRILPRMVEEIASVLADGAFYLNAVAGDQLRTFAQPPPGGAPTFPDRTVMEVAAAFNRLGASLQKYVNPPLIRLDTGAPASAAETGFNVQALFFPGMMSMAILFFAQRLSGDIWKERRLGTLRRLVSTASPPWKLLAGKLLAVTAVFVLAAAVGFACARWLLGLAVASPLAMVLWTVGMGTASYLFLTLVQMLASSDRAGNLMGSFCFFPLAMLGGVFFPFEMMPAWMAALARRTPVGWLQSELRLLLSGPPDPLASAAVFAALGAVCLLLFALVLLRLKRRFAR